MIYSQNINLQNYIWKNIFHQLQFPWQAIPIIQQYIQNQFQNFQKYNSKNISIIGNVIIGQNVIIGDNTIIQHGAYIKGPAFIGKNCQIRKGAYIRQNVLIGNNCVIGNSSQIKNSILLDNAKVPHFSYVGDSILGNNCNIGGGTIISNLRFDHKTIRISNIDTGLKKFGAMIGDNVQIGCNSVINPGSIIGKNCILFPQCQWKGVLECNSTVKVSQIQQIIKK